MKRLARALFLQESPLVGLADHLRSVRENTSVDYSDWEPEPNLDPWWSGMRSDW